MIAIGRTVWPFKPTWRRDRRGLEVPTRIPLWVWDALRRREMRGELVMLDSADPVPIAKPADLLEVRNNRALWMVDVPERGPRYLGLGRGAADDDRFVVMVDSARFYRAWIASGLAWPHNNRAGSPALKRDMSLDYKFGDAERGFSHGRHNPVPLATSGANPEGHGARLYFINGVTRTFWLLSHGVTAFPVEVFHRGAAERLHAIAGIGDGPLCCDDLFAANVWSFDEQPPMMECDINFGEL